MDYKTAIRNSNNSMQEGTENGKYLVVYYTYCYC